MTAYGLIGYTLLLLGLFQIVLTVICFAKGRKNKSALICSFTVFTTAIYTISAAVTYLYAEAGMNYEFFYRNCWIGWVTLAGVTHLLFVIQGVKGPKRFLIHFLYALWIGVWLLALTTDLIDIPPTSLIPYQEIRAPYEIEFRFIAMVHTLYMLYFIAHTYKTISGNRKSKLQYLLLGFLANGVAALLTSSLLQMFGGVSLDPALTSFFGILLSGPLFYSMTRHRLFDIRFLLARISSALLLTLLAGLLNYVILSFLSTAISFYMGFIFSWLITGIVIFLSPLLEYTKYLSRQVFHRSGSGAQMIKDISTVVMTSSNPDDLFRRFGDLLRNSLALKSICFYSAEKDDFKLRHCSGAEPTYFDRELSFIAGGILSTILIEKKEIFVKEEHMGEDLSQVAEEDSGLSAELDAFAVDDVLVPLVARGAIVGIMALGPKIDESGLSSEELSILESAGAQIGLAIENARLFEQAVADGLTGLFHQKYFKVRLNSELIRARRHGGKFALLLIDADHFKSINDSFGHVVGDNVLQGIAGIMKNTFRGEDVLARYGGEEFAALLIESNPDRVYDVANRFRTAVEKYNFHESLQVTVSIGVFIFDAKNVVSNISYTDLLVYADRALYAAKRDGRNRVVVYKELEESSAKL